MTWRFWKWFQRVELPEVDQVADALVATHDDYIATGEYKRHLVYARLIKRFPDVPKYLLGLAIERAVQRLREG